VNRDWLAILPLLGARAVELISAARLTSDDLKAETQRLT
jgi:hypothetical protein